MSNELVVKKNTPLSPKLKEDKDLLAYYEIPELMDEISKRNKIDLLNCLACAATTLDSVNQASHAEGFFVHVPEGLRKLINEGKAHFDNSSKTPGELSPNIRLNGSKTINGQATIYKGIDTQKLTGSLSNLAMMAMMQGIMAKLDNIGEMTEDILQGQHDDRVSKILSAFKAYSDLYFTFTSDDELKMTADNAYSQIQSGLSALLFELDRKRKKLLQAPKNRLQVAYHAFFSANNFSKKYQKIYNEFLYDLRLYSRFIILSDIILGSKGASPDVVIRNHKIFNEYCHDKLTPEFQNNMAFLMNQQDPGLNGILNYNTSVNIGIQQLQNSPLKIECEHKDVILLNAIDNESNKY